MTRERYYFESAPDWVGAISDKDILISVQRDEELSKVKETGKGLCYISKEIFKITNEKTEHYSLRVWDLNTANILQSAAVTEFKLSDTTHLILHRISVIRDGVILDKKMDSNIRILDDENNSLGGSIHKSKKVNCLIRDIRLNDIILFECTTTTIFKDQDLLDKKYFRYSKDLPPSFWFYRNYSFILIQERQEDVSVLKKYFRDDKGLIKDSTEVFKKGEQFKFERSNFSTNYMANEASPYIEIASKVTWEEINADVYLVYKTFFEKNDLKNTPIFQSLGLGDPDIVFGDKIKNILEYVQNEIVYVYDAEVMHGYTPQIPEKTIESKSGDCKAKSLLLVCLLRTIGINSELILVNYSLDYFIPESLPSPFIFNHAIVIINYSNKEWLVDPTWSEQYGLLVNREEPVLFNFLPIDGISPLTPRKESIVPSYNIEKEIDIKIKNNVALIKIKATYTKRSADVQRQIAKGKTIDQIIEYQNKILFSNLDYPQEKQTKDLFKDVIYKVVSDSKYINRIVTEYQCTIPEAYQIVNNHKLFKFYRFLDTSPILNHIHKDYPCSNFLAYPIQYKVTIESDLFINKKDPFIKNETKINNNYFLFSNKKVISPNKIEVISVFLPKTYGYIKPADFEGLVSDYIKINQNNFGVGIVFIELWEYLRLKWYIFPIILIIIEIIRNFLIGIH